jgi:hypothetical protein
MFQVHSESPRDLWEDIADTMQAHLRTSYRTEIEILSAAAGYVYTRKEEQAVDLFGQRRNAAYGSDNDDVVLSLTIRLRPTRKIQDLQSLANDYTNRELDAKIARAQAELDALKAQRSS